MPTTYLATVGQRPQAITMAFDALHDRYRFARIGLLHTDERRSGIASALRDLRHELARAYPSIPVELYPLTDSAGQPLLDIEDDATGDAYFSGVLDALLAIKQRGDTVHLMVAGGRKAMAIYAVYAASLVLTEFDAVWSVNAPSDILASGAYHVGPADRHRVTVTPLPYLPSRFAPTTLATLSRADLVEYQRRRLSRKELLLSRLSPAQRRVVNVLALHDDFTDEQIAATLSLSPKTVHHHLEHVYRHMRAVFDFGDRIRDPRLTLIKILKGWE
ncbi:MAG: CRISPR-associated ring nuclease [Dehalococcoidia bacterium]|nr:CRISPR-associated ring nuclease [Dehalococcoidia bacterium]